MQISVEKISSIGRKMSVTLPAEQVELAVQNKLKALSKRVNIQGFRQGKVPMKIVEQHYRGNATGEALSELIQSTLQEALAKEDITPAVQPDVAPESFEKGEDFTYIASFDVYPEFSKLDLKGVELKKPEAEIADTDVGKAIENMRKQQITWEEVKRACKDGDRAIIDFTGKVDGEEFEGGSAQDHAMVIGENQMLPDFEAGVKGMKASESKEVEVNFPDDYHENLAGKQAIFNIEVKTVSKPILPEVDEEFVKSFGIESGEVDALQKEVRSNLEANLEAQLSSQLRQNVFDALLEKNEVDVPLKMVQEEAQRIVQEQKNQMVQQGIDPKMLENFPQPEFETLRPQAEKRVALGLLMMQIVQDNKIKPDDKKVDDKIEKMASSYQDPSELIRYYKNNQQALAQVQSIVLEEQVVDLLIAEANVKKNELNAAELLNF